MNIIDSFRPVSQFKKEGYSWNWLYLHIIYVNALNKQALASKMKSVGCWLVEITIIRCAVILALVCRCTSFNKKRILFHSMIHTWFMASWFNTKQFQSWKIAESWSQAEIGSYQYQTSFMQSIHTWIVLFINRNMRASDWKNKNYWFKNDVANVKMIATIDFKILELFMQLKMLDSKYSISPKKIVKFTLDQHQLSTMYTEIN